MNNLAEHLLNEVAIDLPSGHGRLRVPNHNPLLADHLPDGITVGRHRLLASRTGDIGRWYRSQGVLFVRPGRVILDTEDDVLYGLVDDIKKVRRWWRQFSHIGTFVLSGKDAYHAVTGMPHVTVVEDPGRLSRELRSRGPQTALPLAGIKPGHPVVVKRLDHFGWRKDRVYAYKEDLPALRQADEQARRQGA